MTQAAMDSTMVAVTPDVYLIRKGGAYYRPNAAGYTMNAAEAGRYSLEDAIRHSHPNGPNGPRDGIDYMPAPPTRIQSEGRTGAGEALMEARHLLQYARPLVGIARSMSDGGTADSARLLCQRIDAFLSQSTAGEEGGGFDREWCINMAQREAGMDIGAGVLAIDPDLSGYGKDGDQ